MQKQTWDGKMLLQMHSKSSPDRHLLCFHISLKSPSSWSGLQKGLLPYENYFEEVRRYHVVFSEYTLQNFLMVQNNSLNETSQGKSQPFWSFSETGTCYNQPQTQQPHWFLTHFLNASLTVCFWARTSIRGAEFRSTYFFPHLSCVLTFESRDISLLQKLLPVDTTRATPFEAGSCLLLAPHN